MTTAEKQLNDLCDAVMRGVAAGIKSAGRKVHDYGQAAEVMRLEIKSLLFGEGYKEEREALMAHAVSEQIVIASVVAGCLAKIEYGN